MSEHPPARSERPDGNGTATANEAGTPISTEDVLAVVGAAMADADQRAGVTDEHRRTWDALHHGYCQHCARRGLKLPLSVRQYSSYMRNGEVWCGGCAMRATSTAFEGTGFYMRGITEDECQSK